MMFRYITTTVVIELFYQVSASLRCCRIIISRYSGFDARSLPSMDGPIGHDLCYYISDYDAVSVNFHAICYYYFITSCFPFLVHGCIANLILHSSCYTIVNIELLGYLRLVLRTAGFVLAPGIKGR